MSADLPASAWRRIGLMPKPSRLLVLTVTGSSECQTLPRSRQNSFRGYMVRLRSDRLVE